jgi:hypothetical protein
VRLTGTLHVSLPTDIIQLFGTGSVPVLVAGSVLGVFELGERFASQRAKDALSKWLLTFDVQKAKALPDGTQELFEKIFGERHFSLKCFIRSAMFSVGAMVFLALLVLLIYPTKAFELTELFVQRYGAWAAFTVWLPWSILIDYVSLLKTRFILKVFARMRLKYTLIAVAIVIIDFVLYTLLFTVAMAFIFTLMWYIFLPSLFALSKLPHEILDYLTIEHFRSILLLPLTPWHDFHFGVLFFWAGFAPSIWMWLYVLALFVTRGLLRSEKLVTWLRWFLDVEKNPFRSIGAVAATLAFIASVAIILVSAEVSRISATS